MRYVALLDTETTSLSPDDGRCIEVAVCLYDVERASPAVCYASVIGPAGPNPAQSINGIDPGLLDSAPDAALVWGAVAKVTEPAGCFVAHRASFDAQWVPAAVTGSRPWVCSKTDIEWPGGRLGEHLVHLALSLGLGVSHAHRAMSDVDTLSRILTRVSEMGVPLADLFKRALRPKKRFVARVSFEKKDEAKRAGFLWDGQRREWWRMMPPEDAGKLPFEVRES